MSNGGAIAQRGFIFQSIIAMIECMDRNDWDAIKMEPETKNDKVDIILYRNGKVLSAIQVKSSEYPFGYKSVKEWLEKLKNDAPDAEEYCLYLVGGKNTKDCDDYISKHNMEIKIIPFTYLTEICSGKLRMYVKNKGLGGVVTVNDLDLIDDSIFAKIHKNSIVKEAISRSVFEEAFQRAISVRVVAKNLSGLPTISQRIKSPCKPYIDGIVRKKDLANIEKLLEQSKKPLWIYGGGGIGKTELVLRFAEIHPEYEYIFTRFTGSINQTVSQSLFDLQGYKYEGRELEDVKRYYENYKIFRLYERQLKPENRKLILIIDNYSSQECEKEINAQTNLSIKTGFSGKDNDLKELDELTRIGINVILTTREEPGFSDTYTSYRIGEMCEDDLMEVIAGCFTKVIPYLDDDDARHKLLGLIRDAKSWTICVANMAWAMQSNIKKPMEALNEMYETHDSDRAFYTGYSRQTLKIQDHFAKMLGFGDLSYQEKQMLSLLTMLPEEGMEYNLYRKLTFANAVQLDQLRRQALRGLIGRHIVILENQLREPLGFEEDKKEGFLRMHPIVAEYAQKFFTYKDIKSFLKQINLGWTIRLLNYINDDTVKRLNIDDTDYKYIPQLVAACSTTEQKLENFEARLKLQNEKKELANLRRLLLYKATELSDKIGNVKAALEYTERAITVGGPSDESMQEQLLRLQSIGVILFKGGKYSKAKLFFLAALGIMNDRNVIILENIDCPEAYSVDELLQTKDAADYAVVFGNLGQVYWVRGEYEKANKYFGKVIDIRESVFGINHPYTAVAYNNLATLYVEQGDYNKALDYFMKALTINERVLGTENPETAKIYNNIATVYTKLGEYENALEFDRKVLAIGEHVLGTDHPSVATVYDNMATVYNRQSDYDKALEYYEKALAIRESMLGTEHPETAITYNNIANVYANQGDYEKALDYNQRALKVNLAIFGEEHPNTKRTQENLTLLQHEMNQ